jgi:hypothetical protein
MWKFGLLRQMQLEYDDDSAIWFAEWAKKSAISSYSEVSRSLQIRMSGKIPKLYFLENILRSV